MRFSRRLSVNVCGIALVAVAGVSWAGSQMFGSLPGEMSASATRVSPGRRVTVSLALEPKDALQDLTILFDAPACAQLDSKAVRRTGVKLEAGKRARFSIQVRINNTQPCRIGASVLRIDDAQARIGWVYAVVLNPARDKDSGVTRGHDAQGRPTVDAIAH